MNRRIGSTLIAVALGVSASAVLACDEHARAAEAKDEKVVAAKDCDMPCCAHAKAAADKKVVAAAEKPCAGHDAKGCPKKAAVTAAAMAKAEPAKDAAPVAPTADPGTHR
jgi:hypothetical protein